MAGSLPTNRWKLGLFVTLGFATGLLVLGWIGAERLRRETIELYYYFDEEVSGLDIGAPVEFRGVRIGKVSQIRAAPDRRHVEVTADIYVDALADLGLSFGDALGAARAEDAPFVPNELRAQLRSSLLTGVTYLQTDFFDPGRYPERVYPFEVPWNTVHTVPSAYKSIETGLLELTNTLPDLTKEATATLRILREEVEQSKVSSVAAEARRFMAGMADRLEELERLQVLPRSREVLDEGGLLLADLRALTADLRAPEGPLVAVSRPWAEAGEILAESLGESDLPTTMANIRELAAEMTHTSEEFAALAEDARRDLYVLRGTLEAVRRVAELLEREPASLLHGRTPSSPFTEIR